MSHPSTAQMLSGGAIAFFVAVLPGTALSQTSPNTVPRTPVLRNNITGPRVGESLDTFRYTLGAGDVVRLEVFNVPELTGNQTIAPDGTISISLIGAVRLEGLSIEEGAALLRSRLERFLVRNIVNLSLVEPRPLNIAVVGEVNRPGPRFLTYFRATATGRDSQVATLTRALEAANGVTSRADLSNVQVSRRDGANGRRLLKINLLDLLEKGDISQDIRILDGDSIFVPRLADQVAAQPRPVQNSTFIPDSFSIQVALAGEVNRVGSQTLLFTRQGQAATGLQGATGTAGIAGQGGPVTITRALQAAGGITEGADIRRIRIGRLGVDGKRAEFRVNLLDLIVKADLTQDVVLTDGDEIFVPKLPVQNPSEYGEIAKATFSPTSITVQVVGEAVRPGSVTLRPNSPFTLAITSAGGLTNDADWRAVELYRLAPDGSLVRRNLVADLNLPPSEENNPSLRDRDVIVVRPAFGSSILNSATRFLGLIVNPFSLVRNLFNN
ncbi:MAG: polysaccharide export protein [Oscillatoriales cyanobacterium SM2_2_1]|nr:polysaccharide export protein [Oscillatoriales cyanobacterium SM2_2_1]